MRDIFSFSCNVYCIEPRRNDRRTFKRNISQHLQVPSKRVYHFNSTYRNIVGRKMLRTLGHPVATCCDMLRAANRTSPCASLSHQPGQTNTTSCNIHKCCMKNLTIFKLNLTTSNMSQHVPTGSPNALNMLHPTMLRSFGRGFT